MSNHNQKLSASELATIITGAIVDKFVSIGLVTVSTNPSTVPPTQTRAVRVTHAPAQPRATIREAREESAASADNRITADMEYITKESHPDVPRRDRKAFNQALFAVKRQAAKADAPAKVTHAPATSTRKESASVTHTHAPAVRSRSTNNPVVTVSEHYRTKLPKSLFDAPEGQVYAYITVYTPDGREFVKKSDTEGRAWCVSEWLGRTGEQIEFLPVEPSVWQMSVTGRAVAASAPATRTVARPRAEVTRALEEAFAPAPKANKPARSAKQLANDEKLRQAAQARRVNASKAQESGVVAAGTREEARAARVTPRLVSVPGNLSAARTRALGQVAALTSTRDNGTGEIGSTIDLGKIVARVIKGGGNR